MKKILVSLALAAAVLNAALASAGSASLSASELQVDGVEMMAEGECIPWDKIYKVLKTYGKPALEAIGALDAACSLYDAVFGDDSESQPKTCLQVYRSLCRL